MKIVNCDGGAKCNPPEYKFTNAYFSIVDNKGKLIHFEKDIGDFYSGLAEYLAIEWAIKNIKKRPLKIYSDCKTAIAWASGKGEYKSYGITPPNLEEVEVVFKRKNAADKWNAENYVPKRDKSFYIKRYYENKFGAKQ